MVKKVAMSFKSTLLLGLLFALSAAKHIENENSILLTSEFVESINTVQSEWKAKLHPKFAGRTLGELRRFLGTNLTARAAAPYPRVSYKNLLGLTDVPSSFDSRKAWPNCQQPIRDQGACGSCWAFAASEVLEDRFCIATKGAIKIRFSPQAMVDCDRDEKGCYGGWITDSWYYLILQGIPSDACYPYKAKTQTCASLRCEDGTQWKTYHAKSTRFYQTIEDAKLDLMTSGPLETGMAVYADFFAYESGVYAPTTTQIVGGHAVKVVGWGVENGVNYWIAQNSWGEWGEDGFFRIKEGVCDFGTTLSLIGGDADLSKY
eukprot:TRINITY_DN10401_c0_g2_i3.p1 TRINITY_DN10401_c0_g2~~TRINITY_DN10401_c0_g2_i3.p1  ORF type:complete len:318 (-),score=58.18 TRINITY_DN10401_c0_g2_i3:28-981(-)